MQERNVEGMGVWRGIWECSGGQGGCGDAGRSGMSDRMCAWVRGGGSVVGNVVGVWWECCGGVVGKKYECAIKRNITNYGLKYITEL